MVAILDRLCRIVLILGLAVPLVTANPRPLAAAPAAPSLTGPAEGATLTSFGPNLTWTNPPGVTQYHLQVVPARNDGPGIDVHIGDASTNFRVPAPPGWYGLLPDMTYTWRVRVSDAPGFASLSDATWSPWVERKFRTPAVSSSTITALTPVSGEVVSTRTPVVQWDNTRSDVFYYEVQLSKDSTFNTNPATATSMVYSTLLHGGVTRPGKSYAVPSTFPLEDKTEYYWRVRPRVQGDGTAVSWSSSFNFRTDTAALSALAVQSASVGTGAATAASCQAQGVGTTFAAHTSLTGLGVAYRYTGSGKVVHNWFRDDAPLSDNGRSLPAGDTCYASSFGTIGGGPDAGAPLVPGSYRLEVWAAGQKLQTTSFAVTPSGSLEFSPITVGSGTDASGRCKVTGVSSSFPSGTARVHFRFSWVGTGEYVLVFAKQGVAPVGVALRAGLAAGCLDLPLNVSPGTWGIGIGVGDQVKQQVVFTVS